jgi:hypothetical protein
MTLYILNSVTGSYGEYNHHAVGIFTDREVAEKLAEEKHQESILAHAEYEAWMEKYESCDVPDDENESCWDITEREHGPCPEADEITSYYVSSCEYILDTYMTPIWNAQRADRIAKYEAENPST